jgi:hypothetical protein
VPLGSGGSSKIFGHLHIVFRDWSYEGDADSVKRTLFTTERSEFSRMVVVVVAVVVIMNTMIFMRWNMMR